MIFLIFFSYLYFSFFKQTTELHPKVRKTLYTYNLCLFGTISVGVTISCHMVLSLDIGFVHNSQIRSFPEGSIKKLWIFQLWSALPPKSGIIGTLPLGTSNVVKVHKHSLYLVAVFPIFFFFTAKLSRY